MFSAAAEAALVLGQGPGGSIMRKEHDFLGELEVPEDVYYGVQTMRAIDNFHITGQTIDPDFVQAMAAVKNCVPSMEPPM